MSHSEWYRASAPGKFVILGEHAVVYGKPAIVLAVDLRMTISVRGSRFNTINGERKEAHGFAQTGGVSGAVKAFLGEDVDAQLVSGFDKKLIPLIKSYAKTKKAPARFLEMMACPEGCISGPCTYNDKVAGRKQLNTELDKMDESYARMHE